MDSQKIRQKDKFDLNQHLHAVHDTFHPTQVRISIKIWTQKTNGCKVG